MSERHPLDRLSTRPRVDSPTYLRITGQIDEDEYQRRLNARRTALGLPPVPAAPRCEVSSEAFAAAMEALHRHGHRLRPGGATYLRLSGQIDEEEYRRRLNAQRAELGLPDIDFEAGS